MRFEHAPQGHSAVGELSAPGCVWHLLSKRLQSVLRWGPTAGGEVGGRGRALALAVTVSPKGDKG